MSTYKVGQVIYAVLKKEASVYPFQVAKQITETTLEGESTSYMVRAGADPTKLVALDQLDVEVFDSAEAAKATLVQRVSASICQRVDAAVAKAREWYPGGFEARSEDPLAVIKKTEKTSRAAQAAARPELATLAAELQAEAGTGEDAVVELEGGIKAKVRSVQLPPTLQG